MVRRKTTVSNFVSLSKYCLNTTLEIPLVRLNLNFAFVVSTNTSCATLTQSVSFVHMFVIDVV